MTTKITIETEDTVYQGNVESYSVQMDGKAFKVYASGKKMTKKDKS